MGYQKALELAWEDIRAISDQKRLSVDLLSDTYEIDVDSKTIHSLSCNIPAKEAESIILLHYIAKKIRLKGIPEPSGQWIDFNQLEGGEGYFPAFKKRTIDRIRKKFGQAPEGLLTASERFKSGKGTSGDVGIVFYPLENVPIMISIWKADEEFGPEVNIVFDRDIPAIFCTEDIVVLTELLVHRL